MMGQTFPSPYGRLPRREMRALLAEAQNWRCCYCACRLTDPPARGGTGEIRPTDATVEHVVRIADGGRHDWHNVVVACFDCNAGRGEHDALIFFHSRATLMRKVLRRRRRQMRHPAPPRPLQQRRATPQGNRWPKLLFEPEDGRWP